MSKDKVKECDDVWQARKSAISRKKDPKEAEERIRVTANTLKEHYKVQGLSKSYVGSSKLRESTASKLQVPADNLIQFISP